MPTPKSLDNIPVGQLFLSLTNPRHNPVATEDAAISILCNEEAVLPLAKDIAKFGLNPLERFALVPTRGRGKKDSTTYTVLEGNRRFCALILLNDPDRAPTNLRASFKKLSEEWTRITHVSGVIFDDEEAVDIWLKRVHKGFQDGIGRKGWTPDQQERHDGKGRNRLALFLLDYAEKQNLITGKDRARKLTTVQRFVSNETFKKTLGLVEVDGEVRRNRPETDFTKILKRFISDLVAGDAVHSRMNKSDIVNYSSPLNTLRGVSAVRVAPVALSEADIVANQKSPKRKKATPRPVKSVEVIEYDADIDAALKGLQNEKLQSLYHSICAVELIHHTPLVSVGVWAFFETLTACAGRNDNVSFDSFLSKDRLHKFGISGETNSLRSAMSRIREYGNTTKHHPLAATFNGDQLNNDMKILRMAILKCIEEARVAKRP